MAALLLLTATGCKDTLSNWLDGDTPDLQGEAVSFTSQLPAVTSTSTTRATTDTELLTAYKAVNQNYSFNITMKKDGETAESTGNYSATTSTQNGVLESDSSPLYWQDNVNKYGFQAVAGSEKLAEDQTTQANWLLQDRLLGFGYEPLLEDEKAVDKLDEYNYRTNKEWYAANKQWMSETKLVTDEEYKRVPLFLQHQRSLVTVIVKAGDGVKREDVLAATAAQKLETKIYSYTKTTADDAATETTVQTTTIDPLLGKETVHYDKDVNGEAADAEVARYDAVVEPYNYVPVAADEDGPKICSINLGSQHFSFYSNNDSRYSEYRELTDDEAKQGSEFYKAYNLKAGENLVITVTLSRESRKILITAYIQPWTDNVTSYVCDDFGTSGNPIIISTKEELEAFLNDEKKNASGNVAILNTDGITLDNTWSDSYKLNAIFNLGNHTLTLSKRLFSEISSSGSLINGTLKVTKGTGVKTLVCQTNEGTVDRLTLTNADDDNHAVVTRAAVAETNYGYISNVSSYIKVSGTSDGSTGTTYVGGIAAVSKSATGAILPAITGCYVNAKVSAEPDNVKGGGIVGAANGTVSGNTFEYGVTLSQNHMMNIVYDKAGDYALTAMDNEWPTKIANDNGGTNARAEADRYDQVVDCQEELHALVDEKSDYNADGRKYRLSDNFTVLSDYWTLGQKNDQTTNQFWGNVLFTLDGNNMAITLDGTKKIEYRETKDGTVTESYATAPMLFCNIVGTVKDLTVNCAESLYGIPTYGDGDSGNNTSQDICAPLAYSVIGGTVENVKVHGVQKADGSYPAVVAAIPAGMVVWANGDATIRNCVSDMDVVMKVAGNFSPSADNRLYAGGLVAQVAQATITQCQYVPRSGYAFTCWKGKNGTEYSTSNNKEDKIAFGGIIGGTNTKKSNTSGTPEETPSVTITDCSSWYDFDGNNVKYTEGAIIGRSIYVSGSKTVSGVNKQACAGNWWLPVSGVGEGGTDEKVIGKKNSVEPTKPTL